MLNVRTSPPTTVHRLQYYVLTVTICATFTWYVLQPRFLPFCVCREQNGWLWLRVISARCGALNFLNTVLGHIPLLIISVTVLVMFLRFHHFARCEFLKMSCLYESSLSFCQFIAALSQLRVWRHTEIVFRFLSRRPFNWNHSCRISCVHFRNSVSIGIGFALLLHQPSIPTPTPLLFYFVYTFIVLSCFVTTHEAPNWEYCNVINIAGMT